MSKKNGKKLVMPKGFRFPKAVKEILVERLCYERYSLTLNWFLRKEKHLFNQVMDVLFPAPQEAAIKAHYDMMPLTVSFGHVSSVHCGLEKDSGYCQHERNHLGAGHAIPYALERLLWSWGYNNEENVNEKIKWPVPIDDDLRRYHRRYPEHSGNLYIRMALLPRKLRREVAEYMSRRLQFHKEYEAFRDQAQRSVYPLRSAKQVKEMNEKVYNILLKVANEYRPACSDVTVADDNCRLQNLM